MGATVPSQFRGASLSRSSVEQLTKSLLQGVLVLPQTGEAGGFA